jgi:hypothetical protein
MQGLQGKPDDMSQFKEESQQSTQQLDNSIRTPMTQQSRVIWSNLNINQAYYFPLGK